MQLRLTEDAQSDLKAIRNYTQKEYGSSQAKIYMSRLREGFKTLRRHPQIGYDINHIKAEYRCFQVEYHRIFYKSNDGFIAVVAILHESQLPKRYLTQRTTK